MVLTTSSPTAGQEQRQRSGRRSGPRGGVVAPAASAAVSMGAYCLAMAVHGTYPFGARSRAVNDLGNQFVPFHAHLWDLMRGQTEGDLFFNWGSGYGVPFLADFFTYLMNPFSWLVALFPRDRVELPVFLVTLLSIGLATALMTVWLGRLRPGPPWPRAALAVGYGVSAWTVSNGFADPMWMWGLVAFPLTGFAYDWCLDGRRWALGALLVAVSWAGNFYTAAMATLGMLLVLVVRLLLDGRPWSGRRRVLLRAASMTAVGVALVAPVLTVTFPASRASQPGPVAGYPGPPLLRDYLAHLLPGGFHSSGPQVSVGVLPLLLVLAYPFMRRVPGRQRAAWCVLLVLVALSYVWTPTILLWHGLALPNGGPYRASFTLAGMLVAVAWLALAARPRPRELLAGAGALGVVLVVAGPSPYFTAGTWALTLAGAAVFVALLALPRRRGRVVHVAVTGALIGTVFLSTVFTVLSVTAQRDREEWWRPKRTLDAQSLAARRAVRAQDRWPALRSEPGPHEFADNDPLLLGGQGGSYYSSYLPALTARTLRGLGAGWYMGGRHTVGFEDPVGRAVMGVGSYLDHGGPDGFVRRSADAVPLVSLRQGAPAPASDTVFARQEQVLGARVYAVPAVRPVGGAAPGERPDEGWRLPRGARRAFAFTCTPGSSAFAYVPWFSGTLDALGSVRRLSGWFPMTNNGLVPLGRVPAGGEAVLTLTGDRAQDVPRSPVGCLDRGALGAAVARSKASGPRRITAAGHSVEAVLPARSTGTALLAVPAVRGWRCSLDGATAKAPGRLAGLIAVPLGPGASRVSCAYRTPGLRAGLLVSGVAAAVLLAALVVSWSPPGGGRRALRACAARRLGRLRRLRTRSR
ncbi:MULTISPECIES: YfhO family protein [unclassified Streptomyces]|uniref:YfhO family protein n=1 Tax=unclassified Streptomyces TaxID=2593676 RepID=UPI002E305298|nr:MULTISPECIES: YfhO family protein [unclassified Streptomyces]